MSKSNDKRFEEFNKLFDDLLTPVQDWSRAEVDQFLSDAGVDIEAANHALYERVSEIAGTYRAKNQDVPGPVAELLRQLRPVGRPTSDPDVAKSAARKWIASLRRPKSSFVPLQVAHAFQNKKGELGSKDRAVLESMEAKLRDRKRRDDL
jgi:3'-phosphoadenosine 5'-phosphosulfate sulfotransferase (PAPS reductase)/FAD synthetase